MRRRPFDGEHRQRQVTPFYGAVDGLPALAEACGERRRSAPRCDRRLGKPSAICHQREGDPPLTDGGCACLEGERPCHRDTRRLTGCG